MTHLRNISPKLRAKIEELADEVERIAGEYMGPETGAIKHGMSLVFERHGPRSLYRRLTVEALVNRGHQPTTIEDVR